MFIEYIGYLLFIDFLFRYGEEIRFSFPLAVEVVIVQMWSIKGKLSSTNWLNSSLMAIFDLCRPIIKQD